MDISRASKYHDLPEPPSLPTPVSYITLMHKPSNSAIYTKKKHVKVTQVHVAVGPVENYHKPAQASVYTHQWHGQDLAPGTCFLTRLDQNPKLLSLLQAW